MPYNLQYNFHLIYVLEGRGVLSFCGEDHHLEKGDLAVVLPMAAYSFTEFEDSKYTFFTCYTDVLLRSIRAIIKDSRPKSPVIKAADLSANIEQLLEQLLHLNKNLCKATTSTPESRNEQYEIPKVNKIENVNKKKVENLVQRFSKAEENVFYYANAIANMIVSECIKAVELVPGNKNNQHELNFKIVSYITEHFKEDISLESIAASLNINKFTISRTLSKELGHSFYDLLNNLRISEAKELLTRTNESIINIAYDVGYNYLYTFDRTFKKITGMSPKDYRKKFSV